MYELNFLKSTKKIAFFNDPGKLLLKLYCNVYTLSNKIKQNKNPILIANPLWLTKYVLQIFNKKII